MVRYVSFVYLSLPSLSLTILGYGVFAPHLALVLNIRYLHPSLCVLCFISSSLTHLFLSLSDASLSFPRAQTTNVEFDPHVGPAVAHAIWESNKHLEEKYKKNYNSPSPPMMKEEAVREEEETNKAHTLTHSHHPHNVWVNLKGVGIGNGLTDVSEQLLHYPDMAISTNGHKPAVSEVQVR